MSKVVVVEMGRLVAKEPIAYTDWGAVLSEFIPHEYSLAPIKVIDGRYGIYLPPNPGGVDSKKLANILKAVTDLIDFLIRYNIRFSTYTGYYVKDFGFDPSYGIIFQFHA